MSVIEGLIVDSEHLFSRDSGGQLWVSQRDAVQVGVLRGPQVLGQSELAGGGVHGEFEEVEEGVDVGSEE